MVIVAPLLMSLTAIYHHIIEWNFGFFIWRSHVEVNKNAFEEAKSVVNINMQRQNPSRTRVYQTKRERKYPQGAKWTLHGWTKFLPGYVIWVFYSLRSETAQKPYLFILIQFPHFLSTRYSSQKEVRVINFQTLASYKIREGFGYPEDHIRRFLKQCGPTTRSSALCLRQFPVRCHCFLFLLSKIEFYLVMVMDQSFLPL